MTTALEKLERVAKRVGWSLRWRSTRDQTHPAFTWTELEIRKGKELVTERPVNTMHAARDTDDNGVAQAREKIAVRVLRALPRRGAAAT